MTVAAGDIVSVTPSKEMLERAVEYAGRSIHYTYDRMGYGSVRRRLVRVAVGIVIEEAFERYLVDRGIPFAKSGRTHWRLVDNAEFQTRGMRLDVKGYHVYPA